MPPPSLFQNHCLNQENFFPASSWPAESLPFQYHFQEHGSQNDADFCRGRWSQLKGPTRLSIPTHPLWLRILMEMPGDLPMVTRLVSSSARTGLPAALNPNPVYLPSFFFLFLVYMTHVPPAPSSLAFPLQGFNKMPSPQRSDVLSW